MGKVLISASIVAYHNPKEEISSVIEAFLDSGLDVLLYVVDNSKNRVLENICKDDRVIYIFNNSNLGFGKGHNIAIRKAIEKGIQYHFVLNPDVKFDPKVIAILIAKLRADSNIGALMPKVLNIDHSVQYLPKLLPSPILLLIRTIRPLKWLFKKEYDQHVLARYVDIEINVPSLSGCFSVYNLDAIKELGPFNEKYFMYFEDTDLSRRIHRKYKTLYFPDVEILHGHRRGAAKEFSLFKIFAKSAIIYFNTYGWFFDKERKMVNKEVLRKLNEIR